jgi:regulator of sigma E protease
VFDLLLLVAVLAILIIGHEFGHFVAAKLLGVKVEEFGLGFPPRVATLFTWRSTRFTLNLLPLGGFVRPAGEDDPDIPGGLAAAPKRVRTAVLLAGPAANMLLAFLAFTFAYKFAAPDLSRVLITGITPGTPAAEADLQPGDLILAVDNMPVTGFDSLQQAVAAHLGQTISLMLERNGQSLVTTLVPRTDHPADQGPIGITLGNPTRLVAWPEALNLGVGTTTLQFSELIRLPARWIQGQIAPADARVSGLKGMYDMLAWAGQVDRNSQRPFLTLNLIGIISAGLAVANLLPFPALDGGRLMFVVIEAVLRRRIAPRYEGFAHAIGFAILIALMIYVNYQDFVNPIALPH